MYIDENELSRTEPKVSDLLVTKASGETASFSEKKIYRSLHKAGANAATIDQIIATIKGELYDGITTRYIYRRAFELLKQQSPPIAAKYKLKQAIMELGPSGFSFEKYIATILQYQEYQVKVGEIVKGHCVNHEIDVIAEKDKEHFMIECASGGNRYRKRKICNEPSQEGYFWNIF